MKIAIIDDLRTECELLSEYIHRYCADHQLDAEIILFESGMIVVEEAWKAIAREGMADYIKFLCAPVKVAS